MRDFLEFMVILLSSAILIFLIVVGSYIGINSFLTKVNINGGPYNCIDLDNNTITCEQVWRSHGTLYGITEDERTIDLKSYERIKE